MNLSYHSQPQNNSKYCPSSIFHEINISQVAILVNIYDFILTNLSASWLFQM